MTQKITEFHCISREPDIVVPIEEATKKKKKKKKQNKNNSIENPDQSLEMTDLQSSKDQSNENSKQSSKKKKKKHREEHSIDIIEPSQNDSEVNNIEIKDKTNSKKKKYKNHLVGNEEVVHREKHTNSENHEESTSNLQEHSTLGQKVVNDKIKNVHTHEDRTKTVQETNTTVDKIQKGIVTYESTIRNGIGSKKKRKKPKCDGFTVEQVKNQTPSKVGENKNNLKRKLDSTSHQVSNKKKKNKTLDKKNRDFNKFKPQGFKNKQGNDISDNPLNKLSDERLKAYGLNPKKYRSFLKYKKF